MPAILFVCKANRIRSVMAEYLLKQYLVHNSGDPALAWTVESAGTWTEAGRPAMSLAQETASAHGLDMSDHRSRPIEEIALGDFDLILTMECGQRDALRAEFGENAKRIYAFSEATAGFPYDIDDPVGKEPSSYDRTFSQLAQLTDQGGQNLLRLAVLFADQRSDDVGG
jgi:protein-tyrosine phosphatase